MSTRYYPTRISTNAILHGPLQGQWDIGDVSYRADVWAYRLHTTKTTDGGPPFSATFWSNQQGNYDFPFSWRFVTSPLQAQSLSGTFNLCFGAYTGWYTNTVPSNSAVVRWKVHIFLAQGQSVTPRTVLLDNYVDSVDLPYLSLTYRSLAAPQTLTPATVLDGDIIVIELGCRIVSSPTPPPTYPPSENTQIRFYSVGANPAYPDAVPGDASGSTAVVPWLEFSAAILEQALPPPPPNDACSDAVEIPSIPATTAWVDATQSADTKRAVWWTFVAPTTGVLHVTAHGTNYGASFVIYTGSCGALSEVGYLNFGNRLSAHRSQAFVRWDATAGTRYWVRLADDLNGGGLARINLFYETTAYQEDDLFLANKGIFVLRNGQMVNWGGDWGNYAPTGIGIDYTHRPIATLDDATHSGERLLIGLHGFELVELADLYDLNRELDFIGDPWVNVGANPAQMAVTHAGLLHQAWFGDGYLYTSGSGNKPAYLNATSSVPERSSLKSIDATYGDDQPSAPFTDVQRVLDIEVTAAWALALNEQTGVLYYTSGSLYVPVGGQIIKRYDLTTNTQLPDFATVPLAGSTNPGLKGLALLSDGGVLVCNGPVVTRLNAAGVVTQTYTPSMAMDAQSLVDVVVTKDQTRCWVVDLLTTRLFQFDLASGTELQTVQPYGTPGSVVQMLLYAPGSSTTPPTPTPICTTVSCQSGLPGGTSACAEEAV